MVYLDHNATTALDPAVLEAMLPYLRERYGNPSSRHALGRQARQAVDEAREKVAAALGAHPGQVIFTGGGTEADNLALKGMAAALRPGTVAVSAVEHPAVLQPARDLRRLGWVCREVAVDAEGRLDFADLGAALEERPAMVSVMLANNETGVIQDVARVAEQAHQKGALVHTDAVQALGKMKVDFTALGVDALTVSAHKIYGPKGVGALVAQRRVDLEPLLAGGGQERNLRSGTENVAAIVGFGVACERAVSRLAQDSLEPGRLRARLEEHLDARGAVRFGAGAERVSNTCYFAFPGLEGETLVMALDRAGFAVASGSACSSGSAEISPVLAAMGVDPALAKGAVRVSLGKDTTAAEVDAFLSALEKELSRLRGMAALAG